MLEVTDNDFFPQLLKVTIGCAVLNNILFHLGFHLYNNCIIIIDSGRSFMSVSWNHATTMGHANNWEVDIFAYAYVDIQVKKLRSK